MNSSKPNYLTSERMMLTINAALAFHSALELAATIINEQHKLARENASLGDEGRLLEIIENLQLLLSPQVLVDQTGIMPYHQAWFQVISEAKHFRDYKSINRRARQYQQRKRHERRESQSLQPKVSDLTAATKSAFELSQEEHRTHLQQAYENLFPTKHNQNSDKAVQTRDVWSANTDPAMSLTTIERDRVLISGFVAKYRSITTTAPSRQEIEKYLANPQAYQWPTAPQPTTHQEGHNFFRNYQPEE